ncbi:MAG TPA: YceI family protein [Gemmatimonadaceae bacterium]
MQTMFLRRRTTLIALAGLTPLVACSPRPDTAFAASRKPAAMIQASVSASAPRVALRLTVAPTGSAARYRVREQLVSLDLPNDAVGETKNITGAIAFDSEGKVLRDASKFTVDAGTFVSDRDRRDRFVRGNLLEVERFPTVVMVPTTITGVSFPLPTSGSRPIQITGDLTVRGVTRPTIWKGTAQFSSGNVAVAATTAFTFDDFQIEQPSVPVLLSVADTIRLEINVNLVPQK